MYKNNARFLLSRVNSINGRVYKEDPTILAWNLINEPRCEKWVTPDCPAKLNAWYSKMAGYVKSVDRNHLVSSGSEGFFGDSDPRCVRAAGVNKKRGWARLCAAAGGGGGGVRWGRRPQGSLGDNDPRWVRAGGWARLLRPQLGARCPVREDGGLQAGAAVPAGGPICATVRRRRLRITPEPPSPPPPSRPPPPPTHPLTHPPTPIAATWARTPPAGPPRRGRTSYSTTRTWTLR